MRAVTRWFVVFVLASVVAAPAIVAAEQGRGRGVDKQTSDKTRESAQPARQADRDRGQMRFRGMDRNGDGRITRAEWRGNDTSFANHDWDGNGVLEDDEVRPGARRPGVRDRDDWDDRDGRARDRGEDDRDDRRDRAELWRRWDRNDDGVLSRAEWRGRTDTFTRLDVNRDGVLTAAEIRDWR